jgi:hypothetical protein
MNQLPLVIPFHWSQEKIEAVRNGTYPWRTAEHPSVTAWRNRHQRRVVVAYGEVTGHAHATSAKEVRQIEIDAIRWLVAPDEFVFEHEEHAPLTLDSGVWEVVYQAEYTPQAIRRVLD